MFVPPALSDYLWCGHVYEGTKSIHFMSLVVAGSLLSGYLNQSEKGKPRNPNTQFHDTSRLHGGNINRTPHFSLLFSICVLPALFSLYITNVYLFACLSICLSTVCIYLFLYIYRSTPSSLFSHPNKLNELVLLLHVKQGIVPGMAVYVHLPGSNKTMRVCTVFLCSFAVGIGTPLPLLSTTTVFLSKSEHLFSTVTPSSYVMRSFRRS